MRRFTQALPLILSAALFGGLLLTSCGSDRSGTENRSGKPSPGNDSSEASSTSEELGLVGCYKTTREQPASLRIFKKGSTYYQAWQNPAGETKRRSTEWSGPVPMELDPGPKTNPTLVFTATQQEPHPPIFKFERRAEVVDTAGTRYFSTAPKADPQSRMEQMMTPHLPHAMFREECPEAALAVSAP